MMKDMAHIASPTGVSDGRSSRLQPQASIKKQAIAISSREIRKTVIKFTAKA
jgi:hypothetical protein